MNGASMRPVAEVVRLHTSGEDDAHGNVSVVPMESVDLGIAVFPVFQVE